MLRQDQGRGTAPFSLQLSSHLHFPNTLLVSKLRPEPSLQAFPTGRGQMSPPHTTGAVLVQESRGYRWPSWHQSMGMG